MADSLCQLKVRVGMMAVLGVLLGCGSSRPSDPGTLVIALEVEPQTLDPRYAVDAYSAKMAELLFPGLMRVGDHLDFEPDLTESVERPGPLHYRFRLKEGLTFSDGSPLTARDVKATIESILDPRSPSPLKGSFKVIREVRATSSRQLDLFLSRPHAPFLSLMTLGIVKEGSAPRLSWGRGELVGSGPYRFVGRRPGSSIDLEANPWYQGKPPAIRSLHFSLVPDETTRILELLHGRLDCVVNGVPHLLLRKVQEKGLNVEAGRGINETYLLFNLRSPLLENLRVRQAIAHAIPVEELVRHRLAGRARRATGILAPEHWAYEPHVQGYAYDPDLARRLLDEAGFPDPDGEGPKSRLALTYKTSNRKDRIGLARLIARSLGEIGIHVRVRPLEWGTFFADIRQGRFELATLTWVGIVEPDIYYETLRSDQGPPVGLNRGGYSNARMDALVDTGRKNLSEGIRARTYREVQRLVARELPYLNLWYEDNIAVCQRWIRGEGPDLRASYRFLPGLTKEIP